MEIEAKPTEYAGVLFRSKLEATWARFFDMIELKWEYEPVQMPGWIPDFLIDGWWLAEVKPMPVIGTGAVNDPVFQKAIRPFDTILLGDGPGDAIGLLVRRMGDGGVFSRYLMANIEDGPAQLHPFAMWPKGFHCPLSALWTGARAQAANWTRPPGENAIRTAYRAYINLECEGAAA